MPVGIPKNPEATAAKRAAVVEARRAAKLAAGDIPVKKRAYKRRNTTATNADLLTETHTIRTKQGNIVEELEKEISRLKASNESLRDQLIDVNNRLRAVLDLIVRMDLKQP